MLHYEKGILEQRKIVLREPATEVAINSTEKTLGVILDPYFKSLYITFDGFEDADFKSQINIWDVAKLCAEGHLSTKFLGVRYHAIGDLTIESDFILACLEDSEKSIILLNDRKILAESLPLFLSYLVSGRYDFVRAP